MERAVATLANAASWNDWDWNWGGDRDRHMHRHRNNNLTSNRIVVTSLGNPRIIIVVIIIHHFLVSTISILFPRSFTIDDSILDRAATCYSIGVHNQFFIVATFINNDLGASASGTDLAANSHAIWFDN